MKKLVLILTAAIIAVGGAGCGQKNSEIKAGTEITVVTSYGSEDGNHENFVLAVSEYEKATGNTVIDRSGIVNEGWKVQITEAFDKGEEPDVLFYFTGADASGLISAGKLVPISTIRQYNPRYAENMKDSMIPVSVADGRQYAVPVNGSWEGLFVNEKVLAACGVEIPGEDYTWEQFLLDCQTILDHGYIPIACSLNEVPHYWFEFCTFNYGTIANHTDLPENADDRIGEIWCSGLRDIKELHDKDFFPPDTTEITDNEANLLMTEDKAAFMIDGSWKIGWFQANAADISNFSVCYVPSKGERRATDIVGGLSMGYYITQKAWNDPAKREACIEFVMAMTSDENVTAFGALSVTALKNGTKPPTDGDALVLSALAMTKGCTGIVSAAQDGLAPEARNALFDSVKDIVTGVITPEDAVNNCLAIE